MGVTHSVAELEGLLSETVVPVLGGRSGNHGKAASASAREIYQNYASVIPKSLIVKIGAKEATGDRSKVLWKLTNVLLDLGVASGEIVVLLEKSVWNKFEGDRSRLWADVNKAADAHLSNTSAQRNGVHQSTPEPQQARNRMKSVDWAVPVDRYLGIESQDPQWMIEGLWTDKSHGIIAGEPKTRKSYLAIDIALSVATGTPCMGRFEVKKPGPVLMIQEEISDAEMKKRLRYIAKAKGLGGEVHKEGDLISVSMPDPIPLYLRNRQGFDLSKNESFQELENEVKARDISLLILDPLQMMLGSLNENQTSEMRPVLSNFLQLKEATGCGILIVHHYHKESANKPRSGGQRMSGTHALHGWVESALYLSKPEPLVTQVEREFRTFEPMSTFDVEFTGGNERYEVQVTRGEKVKGTRGPRTKLDDYILKHEGVSVTDLAVKANKSKTYIRKLVERSDWVQIVTRGKGGVGRPVAICVGRRKTTPSSD